MVGLWSDRLAYVAAAVLATTALFGCDTAMKKQGFDSPDPGAKLSAIVQAGDTRNRAAIADLVEQLDSDDPAVRMYSIVALERITGTRLSYSPYAPAPERQAAVDEWVNAVREGRFAKPEAKGQP